MTKRRLTLGRAGEDFAVSYLQKNGYKILERNYRCFLGEVDIIAQERDVICLIEVKTRKTDAFGLPQEAVGYAKQRKLILMAQHYLKEKKQKDVNVRFDVISLQAQYAESFKIDLIKRAFEAG